MKERRKRTPTQQGQSKKTTNVIQITEDWHRAGPVRTGQIKTRKGQDRTEQEEDKTSEHNKEQHKAHQHRCEGMWKTTIPNILVLDKLGQDNSRQDRGRTEQNRKIKGHQDVKGRPK